MRAAEIARIAAFASLPDEVVVRQFTVRDADSPKARTLAGGQAGCAFLAGNLCTICAVRPQACRDFPHAAPGTNSPGGRIASLCRWAALCPIQTRAGLLPRR